MADVNPPDVSVKVEKTGLSMFQVVTTAAGTLGVGAVLVFIVVPRWIDSSERTTTFLQDKFIGTLERNAEKQTELIAETKGLAGKVDKLIDVTDETNDILRPLTGKLSAVAEAVSDQVEADRAEESP